MASHDQDLNEAVQYLMHVEEACGAKEGLLEDMHEKQQVFDTRVQENNVQCAQLCLEDYLGTLGDDDPRFREIAALRERLEPVRKALKQFDLKAAGQGAGEIAGLLNAILRRQQANDLS